MKSIAPVFLFFVLGVLPLFGQEPVEDNTSQHTEVVDPVTTEDALPEVETPPEATEPTPPLRAQTEETPPNSETRTTTEPEETAPETAETEHPLPEKSVLALKVINDYHLPADTALKLLVLIAGDAHLAGRITADVLVIGGDVHLAPTAEVNGTLHIIGGSVEGHAPGVTDLRIRNRWQIVPAALHLLMHPHQLFGISKEANFRLTLIKIGVSVLMYLLIVLLFSRPINAVSTLFATRPIGSLTFSLLMLILVPVLLALLTLSIIGVPFMLFALSALLPLAIFGKTAIFLTLGSTLFSGRWKPLAVLFGYALYFMATALPYIDWAAFLLVNTLAIGLCLLSILNRIRSQEPLRNFSWTERG